MHVYCSIWVIKFLLIIFLQPVLYLEHVQQRNILHRKGKIATVHSLVILYIFSITPRDYNSFGSRRGNDAVMVRGTFNHVRLNNKLVSKRPSSLLPASSPSPATTTLYHPTNTEMDIFDASEHYRNAKIPLIVLAGRDYGCGPSRDWVAKGPWMLVSLHELFSLTFK